MISSKTEERESEVGIKQRGHLLSENGLLQWLKEGLCSIYGAHYEYLRRTQLHESFYEIFFQFMKERKRKEEALRSAVTGKKIKLKVKKSSKDKEVNKDWVQKW